MKDLQLIWFSLLSGALSCVHVDWYTLLYVKIKKKK